MPRMTCFLFLLLLVSSLNNHHHLVSPHPTHHHQALLDVSAALRRARQVFSPQRQQQQQTVPSGNSSYTVTLHPRSAISGHHHHKNYTRLTLSRLARDAERVNSILHQLSSSSSPSLGAPLTSGVSQGSGEYFAQIGIGRPLTKAYMMIDTGSDVNWLQCRPCFSCYRQSLPVFNPSTSTTYRRLPCGSQQCEALPMYGCLSGACVYKASYSDGSYSVGLFATETITLGQPVPNIAIGCGHDNVGLFAGAGGLLGLGGGSLSLPSQIRASSFSYCLVDRDSSSSSTLDFNSPRPRDSVLAPMLENPAIDTYRYVALTGVRVGGRPVDVPAYLFDIGDYGSGGVIVDSGTTVTRFRQEVYGPFRDAFRALSGNLRPASAEGLSLFDTCYDLSGLSTVVIPAVDFVFAGGGTLRINASSCLFPVDGAGKFCFAFAGTSGELSIIGNVQQQGMRVSYDLVNNYIGFSPNKC